MDSTTNYGFNVPGYSDFADVEKLSENWQSLDTELKRVDDASGSNDLGLSIVDGKLCQTFTTT